MDELDQFGFIPNGGRIYCVYHLLFLEGFFQINVRFSQI